MPNWANVTYSINGSSTDIAKLRSALKSLRSMNEPLIKNGFGKMWLGCIVSFFGGDWATIECRGEVEDFKYKEDNGVLELYMSMAWGELKGFRDFLKSKLPSTDILYYCEEPGMCIYSTNDENQKPYHLDCWNSEGCIDNDYYTFDQICRLVKEYTGIEVSTYGEVQKACDEYCNSQEFTDNYIDVREVQFTD